MKNTYARTLAAAILGVLFTAGTVHPQQLKLAFEEVAQSADLIFIGTVSGQTSRLNEKNTMIFTDVDFTDIVVVSAAGGSLQKDSSTIRLTYAGGRVGDMSVSVSDMPSFTTAQKYLIFMRDNGEVFANPVIGGAQGQFVLIDDASTHDTFVLTGGGRAIVGADAGGIASSARRVSAVSGGMLIYEKQTESTQDKMFSQPATPGDASSTQRSGVTGNAVSSTPMRLGAFLDYIRTVALRTPVQTRMLRSDGEQHGSFLKLNNGAVEAEDLNNSAPPARAFGLQPNGGNGSSGPQRVPAANPGAASQATGGPSTNNVLGGALGACGTHYWPLTMELEPASSLSYNTDNDCMWMWNRYMDIYRTVPNVTNFGNNFSNEFCGFVDNATLKSTYGFNWNSFLAMCVSYMGVWQPECGIIAQSDVMMNAAYTWTNDAALSLGNSGVVLLRPTIMHELGHTWGEQKGSAYPESYDYDEPTVMHAIYFNVVEDGWGVHKADAYLMRRQYQSVTGVLPITDIGVESYYAQNGLNNSTTNDSAYTPGSQIVLSNVTMENMSAAAVSNYRVRFYLSTDRTITTSDIPVGTFWFWAEFPGESYNVGTYSAPLPAAIPTGTYYVGAIVTINGYGDDDFTANNATSFYKPIVIVNPVPAAASVSPSAVLAGGAAFTLTVTGSNFINGSRVRWNGADRTTTYVSGSVLTASISAGDIAKAGAGTVTVFTPAPGGGTSAGATVTINNPVPAITSLTPSSAAAGGAEFLMTVKGSNFSASAIVLWNEAERKTDRISSTQLSALISAADIAATGVAAVTVLNPAPGGGSSGSATFTIANPPPSITSLSPSSAPAGRASFIMTVTGSNFLSSSVVRWNGADRKMNYVSGTQLTASISAADVAAAGTATVTVFTPPPGGGSSAGSTFTITLGAPILDSPADSAAGVPVNPAFSWKASGGADTYQLQVSTSTLFTVLAANQSGIASTSASASGLANATKYFWRVNAANKEGTSAWSAARSFSTMISVPDKVSLLTPSNGARIGADSVRFVWRRSSPSVTMYEVQLTGDSTVARTASDTAMTLRVPAGTTEKTFSWRVRAQNASGFGAASDAWTLVRLTTDVLPARGAPVDFALVNNYPNPFNPSTVFSVRIPSRSFVLLTVFDALGKEVAVVLSQELDAGSYSVSWSAAGLPSGMYFYRMQAGAYTETRKLLLLR